MRLLAAIVFASAVTATGLACRTSNATALTPSQASAATITETFNGTVPVGEGQSDAHAFAVTRSGTVSVTLTQAGPPATIVMGLGLGTPVSPGTTCLLLSGGSTNTQAGPTPQITGPLEAGSYCVSVFDIGNATAPVTYSVTVTHP